MKRFFLPLLFFYAFETFGQTAYIDPTIGNVGALLEPTRPTVFLPNQVIRVYPVRKDYMDNCISSFPLTMVSHRLGEAFSVKPYVGNLRGAGAAAGVEIDEEAWKRRMPYDHDLEVTRPWYYSTWLEDDNITVEFAPGEKTGVYRFDFGSAGPRALLLNVYNGGGSSWHFLSGKEVTGTEVWHGDVKVYMTPPSSMPGMPLPAREMER